MRLSCWSVKSETDSSFHCLVSTGSPLVKFLGWNQAACFFRTTMTFCPQSRCRAVVIRVKAQEAFTQNWLTTSCYSRQGRCKQILLCMLLFFRDSPPVLQLMCSGTARPCRPLQLQVDIPTKLTITKRSMGGIKIWHLNLPHCAVLIFLLCLFRAAHCCWCLISTQGRLLTRCPRVEDSLWLPTAPLCGLRSRLCLP